MTIYVRKSSAFFGQLEKNSRKRKLKPQEYKSNRRQKTQGFGTVWKITTNIDQNKGENTL